MSCLPAICVSQCTLSLLSPDLLTLFKFATVLLCSAAFPCVWSIALRQRSMQAISSAVCAEVPVERVVFLGTWFSTSGPLAAICPHHAYLHFPVLSHAPLALLCVQGCLLKGLWSLLQPFWTTCCLVPLPCLPPLPSRPQRPLERLQRLLQKQTRPPRGPKAKSAKMPLPRRRLRMRSAFQRCWL